MKIKLIYLVSAPYSGSTLLSWLLGSHLDIATVGELSGTDPKIKQDDHQCSCGDRTVVCSFWKEIETRLANKNVTYSILNQEKRWRLSNSRIVHHLLTRPLGKQFLDELQSRILDVVPPFNTRIRKHLASNVAAINEIMDYYQAKVFLDTSKDLDRLQVLRRSSMLDVYVLHLVRDGRGQTCSKLKRNPDMLSAARSLVSFDKRAINLERLLTKKRYMRIRYEDICANPEKELKHVMEYVGLDAQRFPEGYVKSNMHVLGNPMRLKFAGKIDFDGSWVEVLSKTDLEIFERIAGNRNRNFGYSINP